MEKKYLVVTFYKFVHFFDYAACDILDNGGRGFNDNNLIGN